MSLRGDERLAFNAGGARREVASSAASPSTRADAARTALPEPAPAARSGRRRAPADAEPRDWAFTWTMIFTAVLFLRPQDLLPPLELLHLAEMSALAALVALIGGRMARRQPLTRMTPEFAGVLALGALILLLAPFSIWFGGVVHVFTNVYVKVALVYLLAVNVIVSPKRLERLTWILVIAVGYIGFRAVLDYVRGVNVFAHGTRVMGSVGGLMENPNDLALHMVVFLPLALFMAMRPGSAPKRLIAAGAGFSMIGAVVASGSRGGFLGLAATLVVLTVLVARQRPALVAAGVLVMLCALPLVPGQYWRRIASITDDSKDDYESAAARRTLFGEAIDAFLENPLTGVGAGQFKDYKPEKRIEAWHETHNIWLQVSSELGILGFAIFAFLMGRAFWGVWQTRRLLAKAALALARRRSSTRKAVAGAPIISAYDATLLDAHSAAMAASLVGFFVCSFFASVAYGWTFYYLLVLAVAPRDMLRACVPPRTAAIADRQAELAAPLVPDLGRGGAHA
jgi:O-antigen ligase